MEHKIDRRKVYGIMIDTETVNGLEQPIPYDYGWQVITSHGEFVAERSFVCREVFNGMRDQMRTCYYSNKIPQYIEDMRNGKRVMASMFEIMAALREDVKTYNCVFICAHNAHFDYRATQNGIRYITKSERRYMIPYGLEWWDTLKMARQVIAPMPTYKAFCEKNGYILGNGTVRLTAEILYRFISGNAEFVESHTGLEDVDIERRILAYCVAKHKKMDKRLFKD